MELKSLKKAGLTVLAGAATIGLALSGAATANANPDTTPRTINLYGSDTLQDLLNGVANVAQYDSAKYLGSWDAGTTDANSPIAASVGSPAPNGSSEGVAALKAALLNQTWNGKTVVGNIQAARSSSSPSATDPAGELQYIPLARDAVTYATAATTVVPDNIPLSAATGQLSLQAIFQCVPGILTHNGQNYHTDSVVRPGAIKLEPVRLQSGSGTRSFWEGSSVTGAPGTCVNDYGNTVQEHRGEILVGKPNALVPFSISQWVAQANAFADNENGAIGNIAGTPVQDRRFGAVLKSVGTGSSSAPTVDGKQNPNFVSALTRDVFVVIPTAAVGDDSTEVNELLNLAFVGSSAQAYTSTVLIDEEPTSVIDAFGFSTNLKGSYNAGDTPASLRVKI